MTDEIEEYALSDLDRYFEDTQDQEEKSQFPLGEQQIAITNFNLKQNMQDGIFRAIFTLEGAEEKNNGAFRTLYFKLERERGSIKRLKSFLRGIGFEEKVVPSKMKDQVKPFIGKIFNGDVRPWKNTTIVDSVSPAGEVAQVKTENLEDLDKKNLPF